MADRNMQALEQFEKLCQDLEKVASFAYIWHPESSRSSLAKPIPLTLQAATHGNEVGGLSVLIALLQLLKTGLIKPGFPVAFVVGNPAGVKANRRFVEKDLNRSFGEDRGTSEEQKRAKELEPILAQTALFIDFHQTIEPSRRPFFIFPYTKASFEFALALHEQIPIVTHWGPSFSKDGFCSDEYVNRQGGVGLTIELGQKGFDAYQSGVGLQVALAGLQYAMGWCSGSAEGRQSAVHPELFTWRSVVPFEGGMQLHEGLVNFQTVVAGDTIGSCSGQALLVPADGWLLFPKYPRDPSAAPPQELYRVLKRIQKHELGQDGVMNQ